MSLTVLNVSCNQLSGFLTPVLSGFVLLLTFHACLTGGLPKHLPVSLEILQLGPDDWRDRNDNSFDGGIPAEWGSLTNLKKLNIAKCGLDGKPLSIRTERFDRCG